MIRLLLLASTFAGVLACTGKSSSNDGSTTAGEDASAAGAAASVVGGAIEQSAGEGTVAATAPLLWRALTGERATAAGNACPTLKSAAGSGANSCSSTSNVATLNYSSCSFGGAAATWNGYLAVSFTGATTLGCGTFPAPTSDTMLRQFVTSGGAAGTATRTAAGGSTVTIDDTLAGVQGNYQGDTFNGSGASGYAFTSFNSGAGKRVTFTSGKRSAVNVAEHISATAWDHTVAGQVNLSETGSGASSTWTATAGTVTGGACSGGMTVYHNKAKVMAQTCFAGVTYATTCCTPTAGTIVTTFSKTSGSGNGLLANAMNGRTETLTITGCGTATLTDYAGASANVLLKQCF